MDLFTERQRTARWKEIVAFGKSGNLSQVSDAGGFPRGAWEQWGQSGLPGLPVPVRYGGQDASASETALALEAAGYVCADNGLLAAINAHLLACVVPIWKFGTADQRERYLPLLCNGRWIAAHAATEPEAGSDIFSLKARAIRSKAGYLLNGHKIYVLNAPVANLLVVFAVLEEGSKQELACFLVERETPGVEIVREIQKMGLAGASMGELLFHDCELPLSSRLGSGVIGNMLFQMAMLWERSLIMATHVGTMRRVLETCVAYAKQRQQFGQNIGKFQSISNRIADMRVRLDAAHLLLYQAAEFLDKGKMETVYSATAKLFISEAAVQSYMDAVRIHGALGFTREVEFARDVQDALGTLIFSGTSDIQRQIIARSLGL